MTQTAIQPTVPRPPATYEDLCKVPEHFRVEIIDGDLIVSPRPSSPHANASIDIAMEVRSRFGRGTPPGGWWILLEPELHMGKPDPRSCVLVPDLAGWRRERMPLLPSVPAFTMTPDWVTEVLSPGSARHDRIRKGDIYAGLGIPWFWIVDPAEEVLEVYELRDGVYARIQAFDGRKTIRARPFDTVDIDMTHWWMPLPEPSQEAPPGT